MSDRGVMFQYFEWNCPANGSLWRELASRAAYLKRLGVTAVWMPPAHKTMEGDHGVGYAIYDFYDLGEFDHAGNMLSGAVSVWVEPHPSLMLVPSGRSCRTWTSTPRSRSTVGATTDADPLAQSTTAVNPSRRRQSIDAATAAA